LKSRNHLPRSWLRRPEPDAQNRNQARAHGEAGRTNVASLEDIMRHFDLSPLYRSTVGFDRLFSLLDQAGSADTAPSYPPYNIERTAENAYRISIAVAGFGEADLAIESKENALTVRGEKQATDQAEKREVLHQGIAARAFERRFQLADYVQVTGASLENGLLHIDLVREIPEAKKPRQIAIGGGKAKVLEAKAA
jgi:molecular chaperone IbpA